MKRQLKGYVKIEDPKMRETCKKLLVLEKENGDQVLANALQKFTKGDLKTVYEQHKDVYEQYKKNEEAQETV